MSVPGLVPEHRWSLCTQSGQVHRLSPSLSCSRQRAPSKERDGISCSGWSLLFWCGSAGRVAGIFYTLRMRLLCFGKTSLAVMHAWTCQRLHELILFSMTLWQHGNMNILWQMGNQSVVLHDGLISFAWLAERNIFNENMFRKVLWERQLFVLFLTEQTLVSGRTCLIWVTCWAHFLFCFLLTSWHVHITLGKTN